MTISQHYSMHPLLSFVTHLPFNTATKQVGCCHWSQEKFKEALAKYLATLPSTSFRDKIPDHKLWHAMMNGEVLAAEYVDNEGFLFLVQGKIQRNEYMNMRFYYHKDHWAIQAITSIHHRPFWRSYWRSVSEIAAGVVAVATIVGLWSYGSANNTKQAVEAWAQNHGYQLVSATSSENGSTLAVVTPSNYTTTTGNTTSNEANSNSANSVANSAATANSTATAPAQPQTYSFTFQSGMTVHDISVFLQDHHLVSNAYNFDNVLQKDGVATSVWPGTYVFKSNMNQDQLIAVLKSNPSH